MLLRVSAVLALVAALAGAATTLATTAVITEDCITSSSTVGPPASSWSTTASSPSSSSTCKRIQYPFPPGTNANNSRAEAVKDAYLRSWNAYENNAFGKDELLPLNRSFVNNWNGWGMTIIDGIDTAIVMNLTDVVTKQLGYIATVDFT